MGFGENARSALDLAFTSLEKSRKYSKAANSACETVTNCFASPSLMRVVALACYEVH